MGLSREVAESQSFYTDTKPVKLHVIDKGDVTSVVQLSLGLFLGVTDLVVLYG